MEDIQSHLPRDGRPSKFTSRSDCTMIRATSQIIKASLGMLNIKIHDSTLRKRLNKYGLFGKVAGEILFALKRTWWHSLGLQTPRLLEQCPLDR